MLAQKFEQFVPPLAVRHLFVPAPRQLHHLDSAVAGTIQVIEQGRIFPNRCVRRRQGQMQDVDLLPVTANPMQQTLQRVEQRANLATALFHISQPNCCLDQMAEVPDLTRQRSSF
jgi:hypothetical protein